jgi:hypothetical protein
MKKINFKQLKQTAIQYESIVMNILSIYFEAHKFVRTNNFRKYLIIFLKIKLMAVPNYLV